MIDRTRSGHGDGMRLPDLRHWNIVAPAVLLALSACGPGAADGGDELGDDTTGDGDGDGDGDTSGDGDGDDECKSDSDCNSGYYCISGSCEYEVWCGAPLPHHPGSVAGDPVHPACQPQPECYTSAECGPDQYCGYDRCYDAEVLSACPSMDLLEIPLPDEITGPILDLQFVDVDGDQQDELLVLLADDLILIDGDALTHLGPMAPIEAPLGTALTVMRLDDDEHLDLLVTNPETNASSGWLGDGAGGFAAVPAGPGIPIGGPVAIDWTPGGGSELAGMNTTTTQGVIVAELSSPTPIVESMPTAQWESVAVGQLTADGDSLVASEQCRAIVRNPNADAKSYPRFGYYDVCKLAVGQLDGQDVDDIALMVAANGASVLRMINNNDFGNALYSVPGQYSDLTVVDLEGTGHSELLLVGASPPALVSLPANAPGCWTSLAALPAASKIAVGDLDGDGRQEFALIDDQGDVRVWSVN